ncbi:hypothetical protein [Prochlorococcus marinus]|uniref:Uncharacterized protein n=1 Tax=Prochlorococcus marinus (strain MIT 9211) TaxID=93059 RepID=A9BEA8_PROM4|nr:hypothetical protein [Prochlorococcus marinus]ABX08418.1 conserved hypothetical protein [Prochlorococcus marinus str. MIT 9211]
MRDHPIPPVTEPLQYRAIGIVRGIYKPEDSKCFTKGCLVDEQGEVIEAVVLGRMMNLMKRYLLMESPHLWVVYPRCRDSDHLHLQISGIWEPSTLRSSTKDKPNSMVSNNGIAIPLDKVEEGDNYFSIRGELIYTKPESNDLVIKVRQKIKSNGDRPFPFKLRLKGTIPLESLRTFVSLDVRRKGQLLHLENHEVIAPVPTRGGKHKSKGLSLNKNK